MKLFVYGSLKKGEYNHFLLRNSKFLYKQTMVDFTLYDTTYGYPAAVQSKDNYIVGEVYEITPDVYRTIKNLETGAGYEEMVIDDTLIFYFSKETLEHYSFAKEIGDIW